MNEVQQHFDELALNYDHHKKRHSYYYGHLKKLLARLIPRTKNVLEIGCGTGDLLTFLRPKKGYGIDISSQMIVLAKKKHPQKNLAFSTRSILSFKKTKLDHIFLSDVVEHLPDPQPIFSQISQIMKSQTILVCTMANPIWEPVLMLAEKLKLKMPEGKHYRWTSPQLRRCFKKAGLVVIRHDYNLLLPIYIPLISRLINHYLTPIFKKYAFIEFFQVKKQ